MTDSLFKSTKTTKEFEKKLEKFYDRDNGVKFKEWLDILKIYNIIDNKIPGLFNNSKINVKTSSETGSYNLILLWIIENKDKFNNYDFDGIPNSSFINIKDEIKKEIYDIKIKKKEFKTENDVKEWCKNPTIHPLNSEIILPMSNEYFDIWKKAFKILKKIYNNDEKVLDILPKEHLLFNKTLDFLYYSHTEKNNTKKTDYLDILYLLTRNIQYTEEKETAFQTEIELLKNRFSDIPYNMYNLREINDIFIRYTDEIIDRLLDHNFNYKINNFNYLNISCISLIKSFIRFVNEENFSNGINILQYLENEKKNVNCPEWIKHMLILIEKYKIWYKDIDDLINPNPNNVNSVINNYNNKIFKFIDDPVEKYLKKYEDALEFLKNDKYKRLIDQQTLKAIDKTKYLNDAEYKKFEKLYVSKNTIRKTNVNLYQDKYKEYETLKKTNPNAKSPSPPKQRFHIELPNGKTYIYGQAKPLHIADSIVKSFKIDYDKSKTIIEEYVKIKNMSYLQLVKYVEKKSPTKEIKNFVKENILLSMTREQINENILYNESIVNISELQNRCNDSSDILTKDDYDSEHYPLAKLQLLVRLKIKNKDKYKTECVYAPALYNYLVQCINTKQPFINPLTRIQYTEEHINELMKIMKIINPNIERPYFLKPISDKKLIIEHHEIIPSKEINPLKLEFYSINIYRQFGATKYKIFHICTIPSNIDSVESDENPIATGSTDLTSSTMLYKIYKLFNDGRLLHNYVPPYCITYTDTNGITYLQYIALQIHFNNYKTVDKWLYYNTKEEVSNVFKHYAQEINNYIYH